MRDSWVEALGTVLGKSLNGEPLSEQMITGIVNELNRAQGTRDEFGQDNLYAGWSTGTAFTAFTRGIDGYSASKAMEPRKVSFNARPTIDNDIIDERLKCMA